MFLLGKLFWIPPHFLPFGSVWFSEYTPGLVRELRKVQAESFKHLSYKLNCCSPTCHPSVLSQALVQELNFSAYLGLPAFMVPLKGPHCANLARVLLNHIQTGHHSCMVATAVKHYLSVPFKNNNSFLILGLCCDWQFHGISVNLKLKL